MTNHPVRKACRQAGLTLVELMIAIVLSLVIVGAVMAVYLSSTTTYRINRDLANLQDGARYASGALSQQIRQAGFEGCLSGQIVPHNDLNPAPTGNPFPFNFTQWLQGYEYQGGAWSSTIDPSITNALLSATPALYPDTHIGTADILVIRRADAAQAVGVYQNSAQGSAQIAISTPNLIYPGEIVLVTNCTSADIFQVTGPTNPSTSANVVHNTGATQTPGNAVQGLSADYNTDSQLLPISTIAYVVAGPATAAGTAPTPPSLWSINLTDAATGVTTPPAQIAPDVAAMRVYYGEDTDNDHAANEYVDLATVLGIDPTLAHVVSIRLVLLLATADDNLATTIAPVQNFPTIGQSFLPTDRRLYRVFTVTIALRNRTL